MALSRTTLLKAALAATLSGWTGLTHAIQISWVDMSAINQGSATAGEMTGNINTSDGTVAVDYNGVVLSNSVLHAIGYWGYGNDPAYIIDGIDHAPPSPFNSQMVMVNGGYGITNTINFSQAVENPVMAIRGLGTNLNPLEFVFGATFEVLSQGTNNGLSTPVDSILQGRNGDGLIRFEGIFDSLSWTINGVEPGGWAGFNIGIERIAQIDVQPSDPATSVPEPSSLALMTMGFAGLVVGYRRRETRAAQSHT